MLHIEKTKNCSNLQLLMKHELGNDCGSLLLVFVLLVRVLAGSGGRGEGRRNGGREREREEGGKKRGRITHMNKTTSCVGWKGMR